jgi:hypothetical protein
MAAAGARVGGEFKKYPVKRFSLIALICLCVALTPADAPGCGPFFEEAEFVPKNRPAAPFRAGDIGVLRGSYWLEYLIPAWRYLDGKPVSLKPRTVVMLTQRPRSEWDGWLDMRARVMQTGSPKEPDYRRVQSSDWQSYLNCTDSAYTTAAATLKARLDTLGSKHAAVQSWVKAQDTVFSNCAGGANMPDAPEPDLPPLLAADRRYQIAAAQFYAGNFSDARKAFLAIAQERDSPWRNIAPYIAARALIREATLVPGEGTFNAEMLKTAEQELREITRTNADAAVRRWAEDLAGFAATRLRPGERLAELAAMLANPAQDADFGSNLYDFDFIWVHSGEVEARAGRNEMLDWLLAMRGKLSRDVVLKRWADRRTAPWLIAALENTGTSDTDAADLLKAAAAARAGSPEYATTAFHRLRLLEEKQTADERRVLLDKVIANLQRSSHPAALNPFLEERFALSRSLDELFRYAPRTPASPERPDRLFDRDATDALNFYLPLSMWLTAAESPHLDGGLRNRILLSAWVRAELLGDFSAAADLAPKIAKQLPATAALIGRYRRASSSNEKRFAAVYFMLKSPGVRPHLRIGLPRENDLMKLSQFRDNWWCGSTDHHIPGWSLPENKPVPATSFLSPEDREASVREIKQLDEIGAAGNYFSTVAVEWARKNPGDPRSAEALYLAVRATRYGCRDAGTGAASKLAFTTLKNLYPDSEWAKRTPHWYAQ